MPIVAPLLALDALALILWVIAVALAIALIMRAVAAPIRSIPVIGGQIAGVFDSVARSISNAAGKLETGIDKLAGAAWHALARYADTLWHEIVAHSALFAQFGGIIGQMLNTLLHVKVLAHHAARIAASPLHLVRALERRFHGIEHRVKTLEHEVGHGIGEDVLPRIKQLERELNNVRTRTIPAIRSDVVTAENDVTALGEYIRANYLSSATDAVTAAVAVALAAMGLGGLRCSTLRNALSRRACGLWSGLEDLLGLFVDTVLLTNVCHFLPLLEAAVSEVADPIVVALTDVGAGLCAGGIGAAPALAVPSLSLPANPGVTLHLP